jgi:hypothetical protein
MKVNNSQLNFEWKPLDLKGGKPEMCKVKVSAVSAETWNEHSMRAC